MASGDFNNLVIRKATAHNPDGSFVKEGSVFTVSTNGKQNWTSDLKLNNLVLSTLSLQSQLYVASSLFDYTTVSSLAVSTLSASSITAAKMITTDIVTCTMNASTFFFPSVSLQSIYASSMNNNSFTTNDATASTLRVTNLFATNFTFSTLVGSTLAGNALTASTTTTSTLSVTNLGFVNGIGSSLTTNTLTVPSTLFGSSLTVSTLTAVSMTSGAIQGSTLSVNTVNVLSTLTASTTIIKNGVYSTLVGSTFSANGVVVQSTMVGSTVNAINIGYSTLVGNIIAVNTLVVQSTVLGSTINTVNIGYSTLVGSTMAMNTGVWNSTLQGSTVNAVNMGYSTLTGSTLAANTAVWNSTLIGSTLNAVNIGYSTVSGSTLVSNNATVSSILTASTITASNVRCSTLSANSVVIPSTLVVSSMSGSTMAMSTINTTGITAGSIGFSTLQGSTMGVNMIVVASTITASSLNAVNIGYSTLQGDAIQTQSLVASTVTGSTINFANLSFSTLIASTMTANVMFPLFIQGSTVNVSSLLTASYVGIGTTATNHPLTVSNTVTSAMELNRISTTANFYGAGTVHTVTDPANNQFKGTYAYAFGGAKTLATASQSQAVGYYAIDVANAGVFGSDTAGAATGAMFYMDSTKTFFQNTALGVGTTSPGWPLTVAKDMPFAAMMSNPLDAALVIKGQNNIGTLKIGTYFTGASFGAAIQSSQFSTGVDAPSALLLNQLGGNVGIGTNNPAALLSIYSGSSNTVALSVTSSGTGLGSGMQFVNTTPSTGLTYGIYSGSDGLLHLTDATATADRMTIGSTGVTILNNLSLTGATSVFYKYGSTVGYYMDIQGGSATNSPMVEFFAGTTRRSYIGNASATSMEIYCQNGTNLNFLTEATNRMTIATSGNVGIGSTAPVTPLDVNGNVRAITGFGTNSGSVVGLTQTVTPIHTFRGMMALLTATGLAVPGSTTITYVGFVQWFPNLTSPSITAMISGGITASISGGATPVLSLATTAAVTANVTWNIMYITSPAYLGANTFAPGF